MYSFRQYLDGMHGLEWIDTEPSLLELALEDLHLALLRDQLPRLRDLRRVHVGVPQVLVDHARDLQHSDVTTR